MPRSSTRRSDGLPTCVRPAWSQLAIIRPIIDGARHRFAVAAAETGFQDLWQRCQMAAAAVGANEHHVREVLDNVERFVWSFPEIEVISTGRSWLDESG